MNEKSFSLTSRSVIGLVVLLIGIVLTLGNFDVLDAAEIIRYWPVLLIVFGLAKALQPGGSGGRMFGGVVAGVGALMLLNRMDIIDFEFWNLWPLLLVAIGLSLVLRTRSNKPFDRSRSDADDIGGTAILGGIEQRNTSKNFRGGEASAILGGHVLDLRDADMPDGGSATLDLFALMGGVELRVPEQWSVVVEGTAFMGGFENKTRTTSSGNKTLVIKGQAIMGGVEIRN